MKLEDVVPLIAVYVDAAGHDHTAVREANRRATRDALLPASGRWRSWPCASRSRTASTGRMNRSQGWGA